MFGKYVYNVIYIFILLFDNSLSMWDTDLLEKLFSTIVDLDRYLRLISNNDIPIFLVKSTYLTFEPGEYLKKFVKGPSTPPIHSLLVYEYENHTRPNPHRN